MLLMELYAGGCAMGCHICIQGDWSQPIVSAEFVDPVPIGSCALLCHTRGPEHQPHHWLPNPMIFVIFWHWHLNFVHEMRFSNKAINDQDLTPAGREAGLILNSDGCYNACSVEHLDIDIESK